MKLKTLERFELEHADHLTTRATAHRFIPINQPKKIGLTGARDRVAIVRVSDGHGQPHVVTGRARQAPLLRRQRRGVDPTQVDPGSCR